MTSHADAANRVPKLRTDARRNRERILAAARDLFIERGPDTPLEAIAARAGVGIATLYRRFPDRSVLARAVVVDVLNRVTDEAERAQAEEPVAFAALARYMRRALDLRISAVLPTLLDRISMDDEEIFALREASATAIQEILERAHTEGTLRTDVGFGDISLLLVRLAHPLPGPFPPDLSDRLAHRHLDLILAGLRADHDPLPGPMLTLHDLRGLPMRGDRTDSDRAME